jgi:hypothetical protein
MAHLDIAYVGPGIAVPTWRNGTNDPWATIEWSPADDYDEYLDTGGHHQNAGGPSFVNGPALVIGALQMRLEGMPVSQVQVRPYHITANGSGTRLWTGPAIDETTTDTDHNPAVTHYALPLGLRVPASRRLRLEIMQAHQTSDYPDGLLKWAQLVARVDNL